MYGEDEDDLPTWAAWLHIAVFILLFPILLVGCLLKVGWDEFWWYLERKRRKAQKKEQEHG